MLCLTDLLKATGATLIGQPEGNLQFTGLAYDSRADCRGRVFAALRTETGDGHEYIRQAVEKKAAAVLCEHLPEGEPLSTPCLLVTDVLTALADWAREAVRQWSPRVVAVTGSLGKTTTKELAAALLAKHFRVDRTPGNMSGHLGLPVALAEMERTAEWAVLEMATGSFGEMRAMLNMAAPYLTVATNIREAHLSVFGSEDNLAAEMALAFRYLPADGLAIVNADDEKVMSMLTPGQPNLTFGLHHGDLRAEAVTLDRNGLKFQVRYGSKQERIKVRLYSPAQVYDCLAAMAVALVAGVSLSDCAASLADFQPLPGRMHPLPGINGSWLLDDTFSAGPSSTIAALAGLAALPGKQRHLVLGSLDDLDPDQTWPERLGQQVAVAAQTVWAYGDTAAAIGQQAARHNVELRVFYSLKELAEQLQPHLAEGDLVLVKGNRAARLERLVAELVASPQKTIPLVRQESYWNSVRLARPERPTWVEVDTEALANNTKLLRQICGTPMMAVLKADAYGHGAVRSARVVLQHGASALAVACLSEAKMLRQAGIGGEILILGYTPPYQAREAVRLGITCAICGEEEAQAFNLAAEALGTTAKAHIKVDTGMARLGLLPDDVPAYLAQIRTLPHLFIEGIFTHFSSADADDKAYAKLQLERFQRLLAELERQKIRPPVAHAANTAAALTMPAARLDMVRMGIGLYGLPPSAEIPLPSGLRPVLSFKTTVSQVKRVPAGTFIGYGQAYCAEQGIMIATIPVGYADGFRRSPHNWGQVLIRGQRCPLVGNVCMDQAMVDVSAVPGVRKGDEVVLIGSQGEATIGATEVAERLGTIPYEVIAAILARVPRIS